MAKAINRIEFTYTDTFGGEPNYAWVRKTSEELPANLSEVAVVRRAKKWAGLTGHPCKRSDYDDSITLVPKGRNTILFIEYKETIHV